MQHIMEMIQEMAITKLLVGRGPLTVQSLFVYTQFV